MRLRVNKELCTGCQSCQLVCSIVNFKVFNSKRARIQVPFTRSDPASPVVCRQCSKPGCVRVCETGAVYPDADKKLVKFNRDLCTACKKCLAACPFNSIFSDPEGYPLKCDCCLGEAPCVDYCQKGALYVK